MWGREKEMAHEEEKLEPAGLLDARHLAAGAEQDAVIGPEGRAVKQPGVGGRHQAHARRGKGALQPRHCREVGPRVEAREVVGVGMESAPEHSAPGPGPGSGGARGPGRFSAGGRWVVLPREEPCGEGVVGHKPAGVGGGGV